MNTDVYVHPRMRNRRRNMRRLCFSALKYGLMAIGALTLFFLFVFIAVEASELLAILFVLSIPLAAIAFLAKLVYRATGHNRRAPRRVRFDDYDEGEERDGTPTRPAASGLSPEQWLQRRYVVGELTHAEFERRMMDVIKMRFENGQLSLTGYEREIEQLIARSRVASALDAPANGQLRSRAL